MKILLFSDSKTIFETTEKISKGWFELVWYKYSDLQRETYPYVNGVIMHFDKTKIIGSRFRPIIKVKSKMGDSIPILAIMDGTPQKIFSVLKMGVYDYITTVENIQEYKQKIENMILWDWYQKKYKYVIKQ
nr:hypothetical protein [uncultured Blautia sp.]